jgi:peptide methionine sulfoxide reductase MsrA
MKFNSRSKQYWKIKLKKTKNLNQIRLIYQTHVINYEIRITFFKKRKPKYVSMKGDLRGGKYWIHILCFFFQEH